jgi:hypothetical protein
MPSTNRKAADNATESTCPSAIVWPQITRVGDYDAASKRTTSAHLEPSRVLSSSSATGACIPLPACIPEDHYLVVRVDVLDVTVGLNCPTWLWDSSCSAVAFNVAVVVFVVIIIAIIRPMFTS